MGKSHRLTKEHRENLVAFIDGELEQETLRDLQKTLTENPVAQHEIDVLKKTWGLLDYLDRPDASEDVIGNTLTEIQVYQTKSEKFAMPAWWNQVRQGFVYFSSVAGILFAVTVGYLTATQWIPSPTDEIAKDLPVIREYDQLQEIGSLAFLELLQDNNLLSEIKKESNSLNQKGFPGSPLRK